MLKNETFFILFIYKFFTSTLLDAIERDFRDRAKLR